VRRPRRQVHLAAGRPGHEELSTAGASTWTSRAISQSFLQDELGDDGESVVLSGPTSGVVLGCVAACPVAGLSHYVDLSTTNDGGESGNHRQVCGRSFPRALISEDDDRLIVACLGPESRGAQAITIVSSSDGGLSWRELCANGAFGTGPAKASCPEGYPRVLWQRPRNVAHEPRWLRRLRVERGRRQLAAHAEHDEWLSRGRDLRRNERLGGLQRERHLASTNGRQIVGATTFRSEHSGMTTSP
jgi:hypothetical protein